MLVTSDYSLFCVSSIRPSIRKNPAHVSQKLQAPFSIAFWHWILIDSASTSTMTAFAGYSALLAALASPISAALSHTGFTVSLDGVPYYVTPDAVATINTTAKLLSGKPAALFTPITVMNADDAASAGDMFASIVSNWTETDDVFQSAFLQGNVAHSWQLPR